VNSRLLTVLRSRKMLTRTAALAAACVLSSGAVGTSASRGRLVRIEQGRRHQQSPGHRYTGRASGFRGVASQFRLRARTD